MLQVIEWWIVEDRMSAMANTASDARRLAGYEAELKRLSAQLADIGFISAGSLVQRYTTCGNPVCRCQADPPQLHGPYWQWSTAVAGKTITRRVADEQVPLYQAWIANRRRLREIIADIQEVSNQATEIILKQVSAAPARAAQSNRSA
jgi:hypothetical protein